MDKKTEKNPSDLKRLFGYAGNFRFLTVASIILSAVSAVMALAPFLKDSPIILMDEATASLDEKLEGEIYATIDRELPEARIVSIGHRATLRAMHDSIVTMELNADGTFTPTPTAKVPVA